MVGVLTYSFYLFPDGGMYLSGAYLPKQQGKLAELGQAYKKTRNFYGIGVGGCNLQEAYYMMINAGWESTYVL